MPKTLETLAVGILGAYVTVNYLNNSTVTLFLGGAATGYATSKVSGVGADSSSAIVTGVAAASGWGLANIPAGNMWTIAIASLLMPYYLSKH